jgi:hypothetical protein
MTPEHREPIVTDAKTIQHREGWQSLQPVQRPPWWGIDRDRARRPGVPMEREPRPFANTHFPPERQPGESSVPMHGRPNKQMPPVFGTSVPLGGLSGVVRRAAYKLPDHAPSHWLLLMLGDRVDSWEHRARKIAPVAVGLGVAAMIFRRTR